MTMPTARSTTLPRMRNFLNSWSIEAPPRRGLGHTAPAVYRVWRCLSVAVVASGLVVAAEAGERPGLPSADPWTCPASHPIKGYVTAEEKRRMYFVPGHPFYEDASPERCYATEGEAQRDGGRPAGRPSGPAHPWDLTRDERSRLTWPT